MKVLPNTALPDSVLLDNVLIDTNVILDVLLVREPFFDHSRAVSKLVEHNLLSGCISASSFTDIFYLVNKEIKNIETVYRAADELAAIFIILPVFESTIKNALILGWKDFEDAVQYSTTKENKVDYIVTWNKDDYGTSDIPCMSPADFLTFFNAAETPREDR